MPAFLVTFAPPLRARAPLACKARPPRKRAARRAKASRGRTTGATGATGAVPPDLAAQFEEDVRTPLKPGKARRDKPKPDRLKSFLDEYDVRKMTRDQALEFLVKGAWVGIGALVAYFFVVHFVIVRDFLPK